MKSTNTTDGIRNRESELRNEKCFSLPRPEPDLAYLNNWYA